MVNGNEIQTGNAGEVRAKSGILSAAEVEEAADAGLAQIGVDEQGAVAKLRESDGKIGGCGGFAFARQSAGNEDDLGRMVGLGEKQSGAQGAESLGHLRLGKMLGDELDALLVTVGGSALEQFDARAVAVRFGESGNDSERRQMRER